MEPRLDGNGRASAKILIAGGPRSGKTTLVESVSGTGLIADSHENPLSLDFGRVTVDSGLRLYLFGMPRQDRYGYAWNQFMQGAVGAVVIVDTTRLADSFPAIDYFESRNLPFVVAINGFGQSPTVSVRAVRAALDLGPDIAVVPTDTCDPVSVTELLLELLATALHRARATG